MRSMQLCCGNNLECLTEWMPSFNQPRTMWPYPMPTGSFIHLFNQSSAFLQQLLQTKQLAKHDRKSNDKTFSFKLIFKFISYYKSGFNSFYYILCSSIKENITRPLLRAQMNISLPTTVYFHYLLILG